jgi:hypothetical protein
MATAQQHRQEAGIPGITRRRWKPRGWALALAILAVLGGGLAWQLGQIVFGTNWHEVIPGRVYRSAQLSRKRLEELTAEHGIRTVVNLRGCCFPEPWYRNECRGTHHAGIGQEDVALSASRLPSRTELKRLLEVIDHAEYPILFHCRRGADRTGLACAVLLLLQPTCDLATARQQLGPRFGHAAVLRTASLDTFFDFYEGWLREQGKEHSPETFRDWALTYYRAGQCSCRFEKAPPPLIGPIRPGQPQALAVRLRNDSQQSWHFRPTDNAGVHLGFEVYDAQGRKLASGRAGVFEREVPPGESIDLTVALPGLAQPGTYRLFLDMLEEGQAWFYQMGSEPCECEVRVSD